MARASAIRSVRGAFWLGGQSASSKRARSAHVLGLVIVSPRLFRSCHIRGDMRASLMASQDTVLSVSAGSAIAHSSLELPYKFTVGNDDGFDLERRAPPGRQLSRPNDDRNAFGG